MPIKNLIFDWSGTLADDFVPVLHATNSIFEHYGKPAWTAEEFREKFFLPFPDFYKIYLPEATLPELDFHYHRAFHSLQENIPLLPGAQEILEYAKGKGMKIFLLSTIHPEHWNKQAELLGVRHYFDKPYTGALDKRGTIMTLLAEHDLTPAETLFVGDMQHDIETARHGGVVSCAVLTGYDSLEKLKRSAPDLLFLDLAGVLGHLQRHQEGKTRFPIATVGALMFDSERRCLLVRTHKWSGLWGIPGGKIKYCERAEDALRRELLEETGLEVEDIRYVETQDCLECPEFFRPEHFLLMNYTATALPGEVVLNDEAQEYRWVSPEWALENLPLNTPTRLLVERVLGRR